MDTCRGEVLPYPPDVLKGLKAFKVGLCIAFGLASLSHAVINNMRRDGSKEKERVGSTDKMSRVLSLAVHLIPIGFIFVREWNGMHWDSFSFREGRFHMWEETATLILFSLIIIARSASTNFVAVSAFGCYISLLAVLRSSNGTPMSSAIFGLTMMGFLLLVVVLFRGSSHHSAQDYAYERFEEYKSGVNMLRGLFLVLAVFQMALHWCQASQVLDAELCALCGALLMGGARHAFAVVCHDSSVELQMALAEFKYHYENDDVGSDGGGEHEVEADEEVKEGGGEQLESSSDSDVAQSVTVIQHSNDVDSAATTIVTTTAINTFTGTNTIKPSPAPLLRHSTPYPLQSSHHQHVVFEPSTVPSPLAPPSIAGGPIVSNGSEAVQAEIESEGTSNIAINAVPSNDLASIATLTSAFQRAGSSNLTEHTHHTQHTQPLHSPYAHSAPHTPSEVSSRRQLLRYVFHEMRAPLNSISMAVDLLTHHSKKGTPKSKFLDLETLQIIEEATLTMERTLKDTMTLQKIEEGSLVAQLRIFSLHNMCDDIKDALKHVLRSNSVTLNCIIDPVVPEQIVGDHFRIRHVVAHVLSNAIKFSRIGGEVNLKVQIRNGSSGSSGMLKSGVRNGTGGRVSNSSSSGNDVRTGRAVYCKSSSTDFAFAPSSSTDLGDLDVQHVAEYDLCPSDRDSLDLLEHTETERVWLEGVVEGENEEEKEEELRSSEGSNAGGSSSVERGAGSHSSSEKSYPHQNHREKSYPHEKSYPLPSAPVASYVVISITDNGVGMSHELQESDIFKPFNQLKTEEAKGVRGSGLGLAICKKIITFLQGSITYSSVPNVGTTFKICFPLTRLDTSSMDQVEEEDLPAIERAHSLECEMQGASPGIPCLPDMLVLGSPHSARHKAIARAKSFRGEKLLSILHNQSNVFDCPTPVSLSHVHSASRLGSLDESEVERDGEGEDEHPSGGEGGGSGSGRGSSAATGISFAESPRLSPSPRVDGHSALTSDGERSPAHRTTNAKIPLSPPRHPSTSNFHNSTTNSSSSTLNNSCSKILPGALSININGRSPTNNAASNNFSFSNLSSTNHSTASTPSSEATDRRAQLPTHPGNNSIYNLHSSNPTHAAHAAHAAHPHYNTSPTFHSLHSLLPSPIAKSSSDDYITLTEKNVNLHILRTAASDGIRALKNKNISTGPGQQDRVVTSKEELGEMLQTTKILVVDDAASNRKLLSMMLKRAGFGTVDLVEDGQAAVDYCRALSEEDQPRIIFMDNTMPRMTGIEASKVIRQGGYPFLIIGVTGNSLEEELDEFIASGADLVIVKPLKNQSLELLLGFIQTNGFDSSHGFRIEQVGTAYSWVPRQDSI